MTELTVLSFIVNCTDRVLSLDGVAVPLLLPGMVVGEPVLVVPGNLVAELIVLQHDIDTTILRIVYRTFDLAATGASSTNNSCFARFR